MLDVQKKRTLGGLREYITVSLLCIVIGAPISLFSQAQSSYAGDVVMPTPEAASLGKFIESDVDLFTGVPSIGVPIYTLQQGTLSLPIGLRYHAGGLRVGETASWVGTNWNLSTGGMVSRSVQGIQDEKLNGYFENVSDINNGTFSPDWLQVSAGMIDVEPDIFNFSAGAYSGKFVYTENGWETLPKQEVDIEHTVFNREIIQFVITTPDGVRYIYGNYGSKNAREMTTTIEPGQTANINYDVSGWKLLRIETPDKLNSIDFDYVTESFMYRQGISCYQEWVINDGTYCTGGSAGVTCSNGSGYLENHVQGYRLNEISTSNVKVNFKANTLRQDLEAEDQLGLQAYRLDAVEVTTNGAGYCMQYDLNYDYFSDPSESEAFGKRLRLLSVQQKACDNTITVPPHIFEYHNSNSTFAPHSLSKHVDHWGFYNGASPNDGYAVNVPPTMIDGFSYGQANRSTHPLHVLTGSLYKVTYPTGGHAIYDMEANCYHKENGNTEYSFNLQNCVGLEDPAVCCAGGTAGNSETFNYTFTAEELETPIFSVTLQYPLGEIEDDNDPNNNYTPCTDVCEDNNGLITIEMDLEIRDPSNTIVGTESWTYSFFSTDPPPHTYTLESQDFTTITNLTAGVNYTFEINVTCGRGAFMMGYLTDEIVPAGGLRVKTITKYDPVTGDNIVRNYKYNTFSDPTKSSGKLFIEPRYTYRFSTNTTTRRRIQATPVVPLSDPNGYHLGYEYVTVEHPNNGSVQHSFTFIEAPPSFSNVGNYPIPPIETYPENGKREATRTLNEAGIKLSAQKTAASGVRRMDFLDQTFGYKVTQIALCDGNMETYRFAYPIQPKWYKVSMTSDSLDGVETNRTYQYEDNRPLVSTESMTNSDGTVHTISYTYAHDYPHDASVQSELVARNILYPAFKTERMADGQMVDGRETRYSFFDIGGLPTNTTNDRLYPHEVYRYENTIPWNNGSWELQTSCNEYHPSSGFIKKKTSDGWQSKHFDYNSSGGIQDFVYENHNRHITYLPQSSLPNSSTSVDGQIVNYQFDQLMRLTEASTRNGNVVTDQDYVFQSGGAGTNYIVQNLMLTPVVGSSYTGEETRQYIDGLGRPIQTVKKSYSPTNTDVILGVDYDSESRLNKRYEAYTNGNTSGDYDTTIPSSIPFTLTTYEASPLNRVNSITPPDWHSSTHSYGTNNTAIVSPRGMIYPNGSLHTKTTIDPNGNKTITFTDKRGLTVLLRKTDSSGGQINNTFYTYDLKDRLERIFPHGTTLSTHNLLTSYTYDGADNVTQKTLPDAAPIDYSYNRRHQAVGMRNNTLASQAKWYVTQYDDYGRISKGGLFTGLNITDPENPVITDVLEEYFYDGFDGTSTIAGNIYTDKIRKERTKLLDDLGTNNTWLENTYDYDSYGRNTSVFLLNHTGDNTTTINTFDFADNVLTSDMVHSAFGNVTNKDMRYVYDHRGRNTESFLTLNNGTEERIATRGYNPKDELISLGFGGSGTSTVYNQTLQYNAQGWLTQINAPIANNFPSDLFCDNGNSQSAPSGVAVPGGLFHLQLHYDTKVTNMPHPVQYNGNIAAVVWEVPFRRKRGYSYEYDYLNRLTKATSGEDDSGNWQNSDFYSTEYSYDARGNTLSLKRKQQSTYMVSGCYFPEIMDDLDYNYHTGTNQIKTITDNAPCPKEKTLPTLIERDKTYFAEKIIVNETDIDHRAKVDMYARSEVNIQGSLDVLEMASGTRQAQTVYKGCDTGLPTSNTDGFAQTSTDDYQFDNDGNLTTEPNKNLTIYYNHLNKPYKYVSNSAIPEELHIQYDASGTKLFQKVFRDGAEISRRDYLEGVEYQNQILESIHYETGRAVLESGNFVHEYYLKDHVGNIRMVIADANNDGAITLGVNGDFEIRKIDHFYPRGLTQKGTWSIDMNTTPNRYGFSSNELIDDMDIGVMDFVNRTYDPEGAIFHQVDPLADQRAHQSPYILSSNNPILRIDPNGLLDFEFNVTSSGSRLGSDSFDNTTSQDTLTPGGFYSELVTMPQDNLKPEPVIDEELLDNDEINNRGGIIILGKHPSGILDGSEAGTQGVVTVMDGLPATPGKTKNPLSKGMGIADKLLKLVGIANDPTMIPDENGWDHVIQPMESSSSSTVVKNDSLITVYKKPLGEKNDTMIHIARKATGILNFKTERKRVK